MIACRYLYILPEIEQEICSRGNKFEKFNKPAKFNPVLYSVTNFKKQKSGKQEGDRVVNGVESDASESIGLEVEFRCPTRVGNHLPELVLYFYSLDVDFKVLSIN